MTARIEPLRDRNAAAVGRLLAASHLRYPAYEALWPNPRRRERALVTYLTAIARDAAEAGDAVLAKDGSTEVGVALWLPPGAYPLSTARKARMLPSMLRVAASSGPPAALALGRVGGRMARSGWGRRIWYLRAMGVRPEVRRRGVGALVLAPVLARADEEGFACALHTSDPSVVPFFQRHGFRILGRELPVRRGAASYLAMVRHPS
jgi:GNAT superfamily N-acetyltransferase